MYSGHPCTHARRSIIRLGQEPEGCDHRAPGDLDTLVCRCRCGFLLSRARRAPPAGRAQAHYLQHHVRSADLRPVALRRSGRARHSGQFARQEETMNLEVPHTALLPVDPESGEPIMPRLQPGYYCGFSTLSQKAFWDDATRKVVLERVEKQEPIRFFKPAQARFWTTV